MIRSGNNVMCVYSHCVKLMRMDVAIVCNVKKVSLTCQITQG